MQRSWRKWTLTRVNVYQLEIVILAWCFKLLWGVSFLFCIVVIKTFFNPWWQQGNPAGLQPFPGREVNCGCVKLVQERAQIHLSHVPSYLALAVIGSWITRKVFKAQQRWGKLFLCLCFYFSMGCKAFIWNGIHRSFVSAFQQRHIYTMKVWNVYSVNKENKFSSGRV